MVRNFSTTTIYPFVFYGYFSPLGNILIVLMLRGVTVSYEYSNGVLFISASLIIRISLQDGLRIEASEQYRACLK